MSSIADKSAAISDDHLQKYVLWFIGDQEDPDRLAKEVEKMVHNHQKSKEVIAAAGQSSSHQVILKKVGTPACLHNLSLLANSLLSRQLIMR